MANVQYSENLHSLLRRNIGLMTGGEITTVLYAYYVLHLDVQNMGIRGRNYRKIAKEVLSGAAYRKSDELFQNVLRDNPDELDKLFNVKTIKGGERI